MLYAYMIYIGAIEATLGHLCMLAGYVEEPFCLPFNAKSKQKRPSRQVRRKKNATTFPLGVSAIREGSCWDTLVTLVAGGGLGGARCVPCECHETPKMAAT